MRSRSYQRRFLRAPLKTRLLFADGEHVHVARTQNISEDGLLIEELPSFPESFDLPVMLQLPLYPSFKDFSTEELEAFSPEEKGSRLIRFKGKIVRREELAQNLDNLFRIKLGLQISEIDPYHRNEIAQYVSIYSSNLIHLQLAVDSTNADEDMLRRARALGSILGYPTEKITQLAALVTHDYQSLQWI